MPPPDLSWSFLWQHLQVSPGLHAPYGPPPLLLSLTVTPIERFYLDTFEAMPGFWRAGINPAPTERVILPLVRAGFTPARMARPKPKIAQI
jgi:hypothetical protein